jgi:thiol-disulfide isomerase/thioredoxin
MVKLLRLIMVLAAMSTISASTFAADALAIDVQRAEQSGATQSVEQLWNRLRAMIVSKTEPFDPAAVIDGLVALLGADPNHPGVYDSVRGIDHWLAAPENTHWRHLFQERIVAEASNPKVLPAVWDKLMALQVFREVSLQEAAVLPDLAILTARLDFLTARCPGAKVFLPELELRYVRLLLRSDSRKGERRLRELVAKTKEYGGGNSSIMDARKELQWIEMRQTPLEMEFTSTDGRQVSLAKLRDKVVLIEFWASWCVPCKEQIPHIKAMYDKYHALGFEVVGVSIDFEEDRKKFIAYCDRNKIPWPQYFDGRRTERGQPVLAVTYSISSVPDGWLLDQGGKLVATFGGSDHKIQDRLEPLVRKLIGLPKAGN